jgi:predicted permease
MVLLAVKQTVQLFLMILVGIVCTKYSILNTEKAKTLSGILVNVVMPAVVINSFQVAFTPEHLHGFLWSFVLFTVGFGISVLVSTPVFRKNGNYDYRVARFFCQFPNCGYMGLPLVETLLGAEGMFYMVVYIAIYNVIAFTYGIALMDPERRKGDLKSLMTPPLAGTLIGFAIFLLRIKVPAVIAGPISMMAGMNAPLAMLVAGVSIYNTDLMHFRNRGIVAGVTLDKLLIVPVACILAIIQIPAANITRLTAAIVFACPGPALGIIYAVKYGLDDGMASVIFSVTTLLSILTLPLMIYFASAVGLAV